MTTEREGLSEIAGVLAEHEYDVVIAGTVRPACKCGWAADLDWSGVEVYDMHVADALADLLAARDRRVRAEALREAADEMVGRHGTNPAARFLRARADRIEADR